MENGEWKISPGPCRIALGNKNVKKSVISRRKEGKKGGVCSKTEASNGKIEFYDKQSKRTMQFLC